MRFNRLCRHLATRHAHLRRAFPERSLTRIEEAIKASEQSHAGEIRFVVEAALDVPALLNDQAPRERALEVFSQLRVWDTEHNNGVLVYLLLADRDVEIVADRGIAARLPPSAWEAICRDMEAAFREGHYEAGVVNGIAAIGRHLAANFPAGGAARNELDDRPRLL
ncbi:MAG: TPM domain-containing protein [Proteobacteria bacterium]|nr:TPM domain-containing protein [Pseudomonadota bacterium]